jgi:hypothetical protein
VVGTRLGGIFGPVLLSKFIEQSRDQRTIGYYIGAGLMIAAAERALPRRQRCPFRRVSSRMGVRDLSALTIHQ